MISSIRVLDSTSRCPASVTHGCLLMKLASKHARRRQLTRFPGPPMARCAVIILMALAWLTTWLQNLGWPYKRSQGTGDWRGGRSEGRSWRACWLRRQGHAACDKPHACHKAQELGTKISRAPQRLRWIASRKATILVINGTSAGLSHQDLEISWIGHYWKHSLLRHDLWSGHHSV